MRFRIAGPARGDFTQVTDRIIQRVPVLTGFTALVMFEASLHLTASWSSDLSPQQRRAGVVAAAAEFGTEVMVRTDADREVTWTVVPADGPNVVVEATVCQCHDGWAAS
jgi:hypothetical protein